jgi:hypothetical protein
MHVAEYNTSSSGGISVAVSGKAHSSTWFFLVLLRLQYRALEKALRISICSPFPKYTRENENNRAGHLLANIS